MVNEGRGYDEVARRRTRRRPQVQPRYVERRKRAWGGELKSGIVVGPLTVERIVQGRYEWRDAAYSAMCGEGRAIWEGSRTWDPGR